MNPGPPNPSEPFPRETFPPEIVEWARQTFDEAEFLAGIREIEASGGLQLEDMSGCKPDPLSWFSVNWRNGRVEFEYYGPASL